MTAYKYVSIISVAFLLLLGNNACKATCASAGFCEQDLGTNGCGCMCTSCAPGCVPADPITCPGGNCCMPGTGEGEGEPATEAPSSAPSSSPSNSESESMTETPSNAPSTSRPSGFPSKTPTSSQVTSAPTYSTGMQLLLSKGIAKIAGPPGFSSCNSAEGKIFFGDFFEDLLKDAAPKSFAGKTESFSHDYYEFKPYCDVDVKRWNVSLDTEIASSAYYFRVKGKKDNYYDDCDYLLVTEVFLQSSGTTFPVLERLPNDLGIVSCSRNVKIVAKDGVLYQEPISYSYTVRPDGVTQVTKQAVVDGYIILTLNNQTTFEYSSARSMALSYFALLVSFILTVTLVW